MKSKISFIEELDGTVSVYKFGIKIMRIKEIRPGDVKTTIFNSFESISLRSIKETKKFILDMHKGS